MSKLTTGLRVKPSYEQLMNKTLDDDIIKPKRPINLIDAEYITNSFEISNFKKMAFLDLERLDENIRKQELIKEEAKKVASETGIPARVVHNEMRRENRVPQSINFDLHDGDIFEDAYDQAMSDALEIEKEEEEKKRNKVNKTINKAKSSLNDSVPNTVANQMTSKTYKPFPIGAAALPADMYETVDMTPEEVQQTYYKAPKKQLNKILKK